MKKGKLFSPALIAFLAMVMIGGVLLISPSAAEAKKKTSFKIKKIDSKGKVGLYTSLALNSKNKAYIAYFDDTNDDLKYATNRSGSWVTKTIDSKGKAGKYSSIALDSKNKVHISYFDRAKANLKYAAQK